MPHPAWSIAHSGVALDPFAGQLATLDGAQFDSTRWENQPDPRDHPHFALTQQETPAGMPKGGCLPPMHAMAQPLSLHPAIVDSGGIGLHGHVLLGDNSRGQNDNVADSPPHPDSARGITPQEWRPDKGFPDNQFLGNDVIGCCTTAMHGHFVNYMSWLSGGDPKLVNAQDTLDMYEWVSSWNGVRGSRSDIGAYTFTTYDYMIKYGMKGVSYTTMTPIIIVDWAVKVCVYDFLAVGFGLFLPLSAYTQWGAGQPWSFVPGSPIVGGHAILAIGFDNDYVYCVTWGKVIPVTWEFFRVYVFEAYVASTLFQLNTSLWKNYNFKDLNAQWQFTVGYNDEPYSPPFTNQISYTDPAGSSEAGAGGGR